MSMNSPAILVTGATGFIGQYLVIQLLKTGCDVSVLVRPKHRMSSEARVERMMQAWERRSGHSFPRPKTIAGDLCREYCGVTREQIEWLRRRPHVMLHSGALTDLINQGTRLWDTNVTGTQNVLDLCQAARIGRLHYVSSAFVCGDTREVFREDQIDVGQGFRNEYERSKFAAEHLIRRSAIPDEVTIYRPAIVVGDSRTGFATSFRGIYILAEFAATVARRSATQVDGRWDCPLVLYKHPSERRNLVPVNWVADAVTHILANPCLHGFTYHLTPAKPVTVADIEAALRACFGYRGLQFAPVESGLSNDAVGLATRFFDYLGAYVSYWESEPVFDSANARNALASLTEPELDVAALKQIFEFAVAQQFGRRARARSESDAT